MARPFIEPFLAGGEALAEAVGRAAELEQVAAMGEPLEERRGQPLATGEDARPALRRKRVIGRFPDETSCLTLAWAIMDLVIAVGRGLGLTSPSATRSPPRRRPVRPAMEERITYPRRGV